MPALLCQGREKKGLVFLASIGGFLYCPSLYTTGAGAGGEGQGLGARGGDWGVFSNSKIGILMGTVDVGQPKRDRRLKHLGSCSEISL